MVSYSPQDKVKLLHCDRRSSMDRTILKGGDLFSVLSPTIAMQENKASVARSSDFLRKNSHSDFYAKSPNFSLLSQFKKQHQSHYSGQIKYSCWVDLSQNSHIVTSGCAHKEAGLSGKGKGWWMWGRESSRGECLTLGSSFLETDKRMSLGRDFPTAHEFLYHVGNTSEMPCWWPELTRVLYGSL